MPQHASSGNGAVHMGDVSGSVNNVTQVHQHFYAAALPEQTPSSPSTPSKASAPAVASVAPVAAAQSLVTVAQKEVLALMKPLPEHVRIKVLDFMRREFKTGMVIELQPQEVYRVRKYVEVINRQACRQPAVRGSKRVA